ncbi:hypothetical protein [Legionella sp. W05-934-2]|jgi:hypothetical protein|uniref:hypothetical protein n=1 Tax=Legionella sp. W05-934-2 TaxID=1198649 RepID=UPI003462FC79
MSLTLEMVKNYLEQIPTLKEIDNQAVKDKEDSKKGQTPLTIELGRLWINNILTDEDNQLLDIEQTALVNLQNALYDIPTDLSFHTIIVALKGLDLVTVQNNLFIAVNQYIDNFLLFESHMDAHKMLLKAIVLELKIMEYDLSKKDGPITLGPSFWPIQILSNEDRISNLSKVKELLEDILTRFDTIYTPPEKVSAVC